MAGWEAALWGGLGGVASAVLGLVVAIVKAGHRWPWRDNPDGYWPRVVVALGGSLVGALTAAAVSGSITSAWPAFLLGAAAPSVIRRALANLEVAELKESESDGAP